MTRRWMMAACLALGWLAPVDAEEAREPAAEGGWVSLFDGKTLSGWEVVPLPGRTTKWEVKDGMLEGSGEASMLYSPRADYKNFKYRVELKINDKGNSGMYVRSLKTPSFTDGYEIQVNSTHADPIKTGSLYTLVHLYKAANKPDTWFTQEVEVSDVDYRGKIVTKFRVTVDGELLYEYLDHDRLFKEGAFAFQQHDPGSKVTIRKVEVMELPATGSK
ncbi:3-keto-disaccharide hydrolase [Tundrisphaera lichenicola]|uniref:3-keto-disaccharide hydrolase n=1 Tax=Tundrisphaera lichenicola TaxID=2029860 RepID=UPI003EB742E7